MASHLAFSTKIICELNIYIINHPAAALFEDEHVGECPVAADGTTRKAEVPSVFEGADAAGPAAEPAARIFFLRVTII